MKNDNSDDQSRRFQTIERELAAEKAVTKTREIEQIAAEAAKAEAREHFEFESLKSRTELTAFIKGILSDQSFDGPSLKVTIDWWSAWRIVAMQLVVGVVILIIYAMLISGT